MKRLPFTISSKARAMIQESLRVPDAYADEFAGMIPSLCCALDQTTWDKNGKMTERISVLTFHVGWYYPKQVKDFVSFNFFGRKLLIEPITLKMLRRKRLAVRTVNCGYPDRASKKRQVLRAVPSTH